MHEDWISRNIDVRESLDMTPLLADPAAGAEQGGLSRGLFTCHHVSAQWAGYY